MYFSLYGEVAGGISFGTIAPCWTRYGSIEYMIQGSGHSEDASCDNVWPVSALDGHMEQFVVFVELEPEEAADTET